MKRSKKAPAKGAHSAKPHKKHPKHPGHQKQARHPKHPAHAKHPGSAAAAGHKKVKAHRAKAAAGVLSADTYTPDTLDVRDYLYEAPSSASAFVDLSADMPPVWDQGDCPCVSYAVLAVLALARPGVLECHHGGSGEIRDAIKAVSAGVEYLSLKPDAIQSCLSEGLPVLFGATLFESFENADAVVDMPTPGERVIGAHCLVAVGIGYGREWVSDGQFLTADPDTRYVKLRNSWGVDVHHDGHLLVSLAYLHRHAADFWTIRSAT